MKAFSGYEDVKVQNVGKYEKLELGGHVCKILGVSIDKFKGKDGKEYERLILKIDIAEPDAQAGFYQRKFDEDIKNDKTNNTTSAKWKGYFRLNIPTDDSADYTKSAFKTFTTSVERSNPGYKWTWEEETLAGKLFGGVFALKEFINDKGLVITFTECRFARSIDGIEEAQIPKVKLVDGTYVDYDDYMEQKAEKDESLGKALEEKGTVDDSDSDLPF